MPIRVIRVPPATHMTLPHHKARPPPAKGLPGSWSPREVVLAWTVRVPASQSAAPAAMPEATSTGFRRGATLKLEVPQACNCLQRQRAPEASRERECVARSPEPKTGSETG